MKADIISVFAVNGGSFSIKFALFEANGAPRELLSREIENIGARNTNNEAIISADASRVSVRVIKPNEELMIARLVCHLLNYSI
jgi:acetate kinase